MRFISIRQMQKNSAKVWRELEDEEEIILTSDEKKYQEVFDPFQKSKSRPCP